MGSGSTQHQTVLGRKTQESSSPLDRSAEDAKFRSSDSGGVYDVLKPRDSSQVSIESGPITKQLVSTQEALQVIRETVSDTEEESHGRLSLSRKAEMLNIKDAEQEFEIKTQCNRRKSADFDREKARLVSNWSPDFQEEED